MGQREGMPGLRSVSSTFQRGETGECCIPGGGTSVNKCGYCFLPLPAWGLEFIIWIDREKLKRILSTEDREENKAGPSGEERGDSSL